MIKLNRSKITPPKILVDEDDEGKRETQDSILHFTNRVTKNEKFDFDAYRHPSVKEKLIELSRGKCAYCESMEAGSDYDIEHFRPKGEVSGPGQPKTERGYYWLAADWNNLFLSCMHCNQKRMQKFVDGKTISSGKKNQFPLEEERMRAKEWDSDFQPDELGRLLIDPCNDNPEEHLCFKERIGPKDSSGRDTILPMVDSTMIGNVQSKKGERSIEVFGLNRLQLVNVRVVHYNNLRDKLELVDKLISRYNQWEHQLGADQKEDFKKEIYEELSILAASCDNESLPYTAMSRYFKRRYLTEHPFLKSKPVDEGIKRT